MIEFEFDTGKSLTNLNKHGIDFVQAQALWSDFNFLEVQARSGDEPRFVVIGRIKDKHWSAVITYRDGRVRIISVRRSRQAEVELYES
mgnify:FL=1|tara:strand:- start:125 stop:388 length:264 start_codon:yes stop_codon:yes gene_type:complete